MTKIVITQPAEYDLVDIEYYIAFDLDNISASDRIIDGILEAIDALSVMPMKHQLIRDPLLNSLQIRMTYFEGYNIFYRYEESEDVVYIIRVLYGTTDWRNLLGN